MEQILNIFRACGRFIWIVDYIIVLICIYFIYKYNGTKKASVIIIGCAIIQLVDLSPKIKDKRQMELDISHLDMTIWSEMLSGVEHIAIIGLDDFKLGDYGEIAYIAKQNKCTMSNFYFAQDKASKDVQETEVQYVKELLMNKIEDNFVYVIKAENKKITEYTRLPWYEIGDYIVFVAHEIVK